MIGEPPPNELLNEFLTFEQLREVPRPVPLVQGLLNMDSLAWIAGPPGAYKTFLALDLALHVATGRTYQGRTVKGSRVAYLVGEGLPGLADRVQAWEEAASTKVKEIYFLPRAVPASTQEWYTLCDALRTMHVGMTVVDTQARHTPGMDENDVPAMGRFIQALDAVRVATGGNVAVIHHSSKEGSALRGSSALQGAADSILTTTVKDGTVMVHNMKQKDMKDGDVWFMRPAETGPSCVLVECEKPEDWDSRESRAYARKNRVD